MQQRKIQNPKHPPLLLWVPLFISFWASLSVADYGWIPKYDTLNFKLGFDYFASEENFSSEGNRADLRYQNELADYKKYQFWLEPEYGFARDWSALLRLNFLSHMVNSTTTGTLASSSGFSDSRLAIKWRAKNGHFSIAPELTIRLPIYSDSPNGTEDLIRGDGTFSTSLLSHFMYRIHGLYSVMTPGLMLPTKGYSTQFLLSTAVGYNLKIVYFRLFSDLSLSLGKTTPASEENLNPVLGSGATYAIASLSPDIFSMGLKTGLTFMPRYRIEAAISKSMFGNRAPNYLQFTLNLFASFDYFKPEERIKVKEVPFETEVQTPED